ncbi:MAG: TolC family outer membrane protein [Rhodoferax sp.]
MQKTALAAVLLGSGAWAQAAAGAPGADAASVAPASAVMPVATSAPTSAPVLDLAQAVQAALSRDASILATRAATQAQREALAVARGQLLPNVSISAGYNRNVLDTRTRRYDTRDYYTGQNAALQVRQPLLRRNLTLGVDQAQTVVDDAEAALAAEEQQLTVKVAAAYFDALQSAYQLRLAQAQVAATRTQRDAAKAALAAGQGTRTDVDDAQARLDLAQAQVLEAQGQAELTRRTLASLVQQPVAALAALDGARVQPDVLGPRSLDEWVARAIENSPELRSLSARVATAELELQKAQAGHWPTLDGTLTWSTQNSENVSSLHTEYHQRQIGLQLNVPLYAGGVVQAQVRQASAQLERYTQQREAAQRELALKVQREWRTATESAAKIAALEQAVRSAELALDSSEKSRQAGVRTVVDVLNAQQQLQVAQRDLAQVRHNYAVALVKLWALAGLADAAHVAQVNAWLKPGG